MPLLCRTSTAWSVLMRACSPVCTPLLIAVTDHGTLEEGESQLMMGRMLPILQDLTNFVNRVYTLVKNIVWQLSAFHSKSR